MRVRVCIRVCVSMFTVVVHVIFSIPETELCDKRSFLKYAHRLFFVEYSSSHVRGMGEDQFCVSSCVYTCVCFYVHSCGSRSFLFSGDRTV